MKKKTILNLLLISIFILTSCKSPTSNPDTYELIVNVSPTEGGSVNPVSKTYDENTPIQLLANPVEGWRFSGWTGDITESANPHTIRMTQDYVITANFEKRNYELTIITEGEGSVLEEVVTGKEYPFQTTVRLTAQPANGWQFDQWEGALTGTENPQNLTITSAVEVTARFREVVADFTFDTLPFVDSWQAQITGSFTLPESVSDATVGVCYGTSEIPDDNDVCKNIINTSSPFTFNIINLNENTHYYLRGYTIVDEQRIFSENQGEFVTPDISFQKGDGVTDLDGNHYKTVLIGQQEWMAQNLNSSKYADGTDILPSHIRIWDGFFLNEYMSTNPFGNLYSRNVIEYTESSVCPVGWHVPSLSEWNYMLDNVGRDQAGRKLRAKGPIFWQDSQNTTNETGFSAVASGYFPSLTNSGKDVRRSAYYYTSSAGGVDFNWSVEISGVSDEVSVRGYVQYIAIRCVKDGIDVPTEPLAVVNIPQITDIQPTRAIIETSYEQPGSNTITERGVCLSESGDPTIYDTCFKDDEYGPGTYSVEISGFSAETTYKVRSYAFTEDGFSYGPTTEFTTDSYDYSEGNGVTDNQGNNYKSVIINGHEWMAENLRSTQFRSGAAIPLITSYEVFKNNSNPAYVWPDMDEENMEIYGPLYSSSVVDGLSQVCPVGWKVPTSNDVEALAKYLGEYDYRTTYSRENGNLIGGLLKSTSDLWNSPNVNAVDYFGFSAEPAGWVSPYTMGNSGAWSPFWMINSTTGSSGYYSVFAQDGSLLVATYGSYALGYGISIRCIKL
ncbi:MAG TPA: hypothetical protein DCE78_02775 [Bacteroidetes bacterium]|nr:hypothetical protein [Bacteroidota bacterium]